MGHVGNLRRATLDDAADLTRLRGLMNEAMGTPAGDPAWRTACEQALVRRLAEQDFVAFVVEADDRVVSCGVGWLEEHLPSPRQLDGRRGHIASMSTEAAYQRRGYGRLVFGALMGWFAAYDIPRVDLRATPDGRPLYEAFGFRELGGASMAWTAPGVGPGMPLSRP
jgi:GNAT superfamily N-acetyltransferase